MQDDFLISNLEQLGETLGSPSARTQEKVTESLDDAARQFIAESPMVLVATCDRQMNMDVSPKGDRPGFVQVEDDRTLLMPDRSGNRLAYGFRNIIETKSVGLLFLVPGVRETLRVNGTAVISRAPGLLERFRVDGKAALLVTRVSVRECFFHCGKAFIRSTLWQPESWHASGAKDAAARNWSSRFGLTESAVHDVLANDYRNNL